jgi:multiple sugar transport system ATP-binding protein
MQLDTPLHLYNSPANKFVAGFIGSPTMNFLNGSIQKQENYFFIHESTDCKISLGPFLSKGLEKYIDKPVQIGIRPEHICISEDDSINEKPDCILKILAHENMGNEQLVYLSLGGLTLIARRPPRESIEIEHQVGVRFAKDKIFYMDAVSGDVIDKLN